MIICKSLVIIRESDIVKGEVYGAEKTGLPKYINSKGIANTLAIKV